MVDPFAHGVVGVLDPATRIFGEGGDLLEGTLETEFGFVRISGNDTCSVILDDELMEMFVLPSHRGLYYLVEVCERDILGDCDGPGDERFDSLQCYLEFVCGHGFGM